MYRLRKLPRSAVAALVVAALAAGSVMAAFAQSGGGEPVPLVSGPGGFPVVSDQAAAALNGSDLLRDAPWLNQTSGSPSLKSVEALPSLVFPPGTTYDEAIRNLYGAVKSTGSLPMGASLGPPLPKQIVFARSSTQSALSLTAPFGYDIGTENVLLPSLYFPPSMTDAEIERASKEAFDSHRAIPAGAAVVGNPLEACQVMIDDERSPECR